MREKESQQAKSKESKSKNSLKRRTETDQNPNDSKRVKNTETDDDGIVEKSEDVKIQLFQRLWSEDDVIAMLNGLIKFHSEKGIEQSKDMSAFLEFIKSSLSFDVSLSQLKDKVSKLKKRMEKHYSKGNLKFANLRDQEVFNLAKIWGSELGESSLKLNGKAKSGRSNHERNVKDLDEPNKEAEKEVRIDVDVERNSGRKDTVILDKVAVIGGNEDDVLKIAHDMVDGTKKAEMEKKWKKLCVTELKLFLRRNDLLTKQAKLMLEVYKNEDA